jgi:hypothetical protein
MEPLGADGVVPIPEQAVNANATVATVQARRVNRRMKIQFPLSV